ncbi:MAG: SDR family oxidoreductase [Microthrixaceae bacterium]
MNGDESATPQEPLSSLGVEALFGVTDRSALVTGASRGIGRMIAEGLVVSGARVLIAARASEDLERTVSELASLGSCEAVESDVTTADGRAAIVQAVSERGSLDLLVNNAGMAVPESLGSIDPGAADSDAGAEPHRSPVAHRCVAAGPATRRRCSGSDAGGDDRFGGRHPGAESPTVHLRGVQGGAAFTHPPAGRARDRPHQRQCHRPRHVPLSHDRGHVGRSGMLERINAAIPAGRIGGSAQDITAAVLYLASRARAYLNGAVIPVDGGVSTTHG